MNSVAKDIASLFIITILTVKHFRICSFKGQISDINKGVQSNILLYTANFTQCIWADTIEIQCKCIGNNILYNQYLR